MHARSRPKRFKVAWTSPSSACAWRPGVGSDAFARTTIYLGSERHPSRWKNVARGKQRKNGYDSAQR